MSLPTASASHTRSWHWRFVRVFFIVFFVGTHFSNAANTRLAIIGANDTEPARSLLTAEFSKFADLAVLERAELEKTVSEQSLASSQITASDAIRIGQLLKADALLLLSSDSAKKTLTMRLVAVAPGVALVEDTFPSPVPEPEKWATIITGKLAPYLMNLAVGGADRPKLSILRIRSITSGEKSRSLEKELGILLVRRLLKETSLWVLERWQMSSLEWENSIAGSPQANFWTGSYLLDGSLSADQKTLSVSARLRSRGQETEIPLEATGADLPALADALAKKILATLKVKPAEQSWDVASEARQYYEEALWAYRWRLDKEASEAGDAAWALGLRNDSLALLRCSAEARPLEERVLFDTDMEDVRKLEPWMLENASTMTDRMHEALSWKGEPVPEAWLARCTDFVWAGSRVLSVAYYAPELSSDDAAIVALVRTRMREICARLKPAAERYPRPNGERKEIEFAPFTFGAPLQSLYAVRGIFEPLWQENAADCVRQMKLLFDEINNLPAELHTPIKVKVIAERPLNAPWIAYWNPEDRKRVPFAALQKALLESKSPEAPIDVALIRIERRIHVRRDVDIDRFDPDQMLLALRDLQQAVWDARGAIARNEIPAARLYDDVFSTMRSAEGATNEYASPDIDAETQAFYLRLIKYLISEEVRDPNIFFRWDRKLSQQEARELLQATREALSQRKLPYLEKLEKRFVDRAGETAELPRPSPLVTPQKVLKPVWTVSQKQIVGDARINTAVVVWRNGKLWLAGQDMDDAFWTDQPNCLYVFDPKTARSEKLPAPPGKEHISDVEFNGEDIFLARGRSLSHYISREKRWVDVPVPEVQRPNLWCFGRKLYLDSYGGMIIQLDLATGKSEVLASSRRRPALTILDDVPIYEVRKIFTDAKGGLCAVIEQDRQICIHRFDESTKTWKKIFDGKDAIDGKPFDRALLLSAVGEDGFRFKPGDCLTSVLSLLITENPSVQLPPNSGIKPPPFFPNEVIDQRNKRRLEQIRRRSVGIVEGAAVVGDSVWLLSTLGGTGKNYLEKISNAGIVEATLAVDVPKLQLPSRMVATSEGFLIYPDDLGAAGAFFFRREDLAVKQ